MNFRKKHIFLGSVLFLKILKIMKEAASLSNFKKKKTTLTSSFVAGLNRSLEHVVPMFSENYFTDLISFL